MATGEAVNKIRTEVSEFNAKKGSSTPPPTSPSTTQDDAKVVAAQKLDEQQAAERVAREGEQKRLQQELDEKILTEPLPSVFLAPIAIMLPSDERETENPKS